MLFFVTFSESIGLFTGGEVADVTVAGLTVTGELTSNDIPVRRHDSFVATFLRPEISDQRIARHLLAGFRFDKHDLLATGSAESEAIH